MNLHGGFPDLTEFQNMNSFSNSSNALLKEWVFFLRGKLRRKVTQVQLRECV